MTTSTTRQLPRAAALLTGASLVAMAAAAGFSYGYVLNGLPTGPEALGQYISNAQPLLRAGVAGFIFILICDALAAWGLYLLLKPVNRPLALLMAWFRLLYAAFLATGISHLLVLLQPEPAAVVALRSFYDTWSAGLIVFGVHLFVLGYLLLKARYIPDLLGILALAAAVCYTGSNLAGLLSPGYSQYKASVEQFISIPMAAGELALALWLLFRGGKAKAARLRQQPISA